MRLRNRVVPQELRVDTLVHEQDDIQHPAIMARSIVLEMMDNAIQTSAKKKFSPKMKEGLQIFDKIKNYENLLKLVEEEDLV